MLFTSDCRHTNMQVHTPSPGFQPNSENSYYSLASCNLLQSRLVRCVADCINRSGGKVLDIGCGKGEFSSLLGVSVNYTGFDAAIEKSDCRHDRCRTIFPWDACSTFPFESECFDHVVSFWCLEHLSNPQVMLSEAARVTRSGGTIHLIFPNYDNPLRRCPSWWCDVEEDDSLRSLLRRPGIQRATRQTLRRIHYFVHQLGKQVWLDCKLSPVFQINPDPAYKRLPWSRDRDAIHIVSGRSVSRELSRLGCLSARDLEANYFSFLPVFGSFFRWSAECYIIATRPPGY